jgi:hypothetical protein
MPAPSKAMREAAAIAEHHPEELYARNKSLLKMTKSELHDYASTPEKGLPKRVKHSSDGDGHWSGH